jgi:cobalamin biosynthetic protein CobC
MVMARTPDPIAHGGALTEAIAKHGGEASQWLDLSTGISPFSLPFPELSANAWRRLPEQTEARRVSERAMKYYGGSVLPLAVPGTQAAIQLLPFLRPDAGEVAIVSPTYGEYEHSFRRAGIQVVPVATLDAAASTRAGIVVLANPNNPDGRETMRDDVFGFVRAQRHRLVIVDEAFADLRQDLTMTGAAGMEPNLIVMRSFGKFFGSPDCGSVSFLPSRCSTGFWRTVSGPGRCRDRRWRLRTMLFRAWTWFRNCETGSTRHTSRPARR